MSSPTAKRFKLPSVDQAERTLELDLRALHGDAPRGKADTPTEVRRLLTKCDDSTVVLDLTATQIHKLISGDE